MLVFVISICIIPILFSLSKPPKPRHLKHLEKKFISTVVEKLLVISTQHRKWVYGTTIVVVLIAIWGATQMEATGNLTSDLPESDPILKDINFIQDNFNGAIPFEVLIDYKNDGRKFDKKVLSKVDSVQQFLHQDTVFSKPISVVNFIKMINMAYYGNNPAKYELIERRDMRRLKGYMDTFRADLKRIKKVYVFQDSIRIGNENYVDSVLLNYPKVAQKVMDYQPQQDSIDSLSMDKGPSKQAILDFLAKGRPTQKVLSVSEKYFPSLGMGFSLKELVDTAHTTYRVRMQILDLGSYEVDKKIKGISKEIETILNPDYTQVNSYFKKFKEGKTNYVDSIFTISNAYRNNVAYHIADGNDSLMFQFDLDPDLLATNYKKDDFEAILKKSIEEERLDFLITGTSVVTAEGTQYLIKNLLKSLSIAIVIIAFLMALLFRSWKMVIISLVPNFIPLLTTAGIMGIFNIPIKPSTLLVFSIAFGISVDDTIHFLAKYRQELKTKEWDLKGCVVTALRETGLGMFYTSIVLFFGFSMFVFSQFGGTQALGLLVSFTLLFAMITNLTLLPSLLLSLESRIATKAFREPYINLYDEEVDIDLEELEVDPRTRIDQKYEDDDEK
jgi:predicted RND superfamily exporter protein